MTKVNPYSMYPVTIFPARYGGVYEGAPWIALDVHPYHRAVLEATSDDLTCGDFFSQENNPVKIGRGDTPDKALKNLCEVKYGSSDEV